MNSDLLGLELEVFAGLGLYPTYVVMQGFSTSTSVILLSLQNVYVFPFSIYFKSS